MYVPPHSHAPFCPGASERERAYSARILLGQSIGSFTAADCPMNPRTGASTTQTAEEEVDTAVVDVSVETLS